jgi:hypothetical protein
MIYVDVQNRMYFKDPADTLVAVDDVFENAVDYGVTREGEVVSAWEYNGVSFRLDSGED